jgi:hypothetical protein
MIKISMYDRCKDRYCLDESIARELYIKILSVMSIKNVMKEIILDFSRIDIVSSDFFYHMIGRLLKDYTSDQVSSVVKIINAKKTTQSSFLFTLEHYNRYFRDSDYKQKIDEAFGVNKKVLKEKDQPVEKRKYKKRARKEDITLCSF